MDWHEYIHSDPEVLNGKPVVKGTRLAVDFILGLLASGWTEDQLFESYPGLTRAALNAIFSYAIDNIQDVRLTPTR